MMMNAERKAIFPHGILCRGPHISTFFSFHSSSACANIKKERKKKKFRLAREKRESDVCGYVVLSLLQLISSHFPLSHWKPTRSLALERCLTRKSRRPSNCTRENDFVVRQ
jgi:hypothetical protein